MLAALLLAGEFVACTGCGTTRSTDTTRTATEQLLISDAIDRAVQSMNLQTLAGQSVYLDDSKLVDTVDKNYYISTLRQQLLASGCELRDTRDEAEFVVEARAGAIGTDRNDLLFGLPSMNVPQIPLVQPVPAAIPEIPIAKRKDQRGIAKIAVFAYHRATGTPVWQSGIVQQESSANDVWIFGAGPFQRGTIHEGTAFAGKSIGNEESKDEPTIRRMPTTSITKESTFNSPAQLAKRQPAPTNDLQKIELAAYQDRATKASTAAMPPMVAHNATNGPLMAGTTKVDALATTPPTKIDDSPQPTTSPLSGSTLPPSIFTPPAGAVGALGSAPVDSAYLRTGANLPLPQPRFNSPK